MLKCILIFILCCWGSVFANEIKMAALGNSISQGTDIFGFGIYPRYNWATGDLIDSVAMKLERELNTPVVTKNLSILGAPSSLLWLEFEMLGDFIPEFTTIEIGANDICQNTHAEILANIRQILDKLLEKNPYMKIILMPIPRISSIPDAIDTLYCRTIWNVTCPYLLGVLVTKEQRATRQLEVDGINYSMGEMVKNYPQVSFNPEVGTSPITNAEISTVDCFHPSVIGQQHLANSSFP